jgi:hypothetical protein
VAQRRESETTMKTNKKKYQKWLLDQISFDGYNIEEPKTDAEKLSTAMSICRQEVGHMERRVGTQAMIEYWLSSLCSVISLPYLYSDIIETAKQFTDFDSKSESDTEKLCSNWFHYAAATLAQMERKS